MREEVKNWLRQADADLKSAKDNINSGNYYLAVFCCQQTVEKALKALILEEKKELIKSHNISKLAKLLDFPKELLKKIAELEPVYQETRYPNISSKIPADEFEEKDSSDFLNTANEVLKWVKKKII